MKKKQILKLILFLIWFSTILQPADATFDIIFGYLLSYVVEALFGTIGAPLLKYVIGGPGMIVKDALTAATPVLGLTLFGENGSWVAFSIISSIIQAIIGIVWWIITTVAEIIIAIFTSSAFQYKVWEKIEILFSWIPAAIGDISSFFLTSIAGKSYWALVARGRSLGDTSIDALKPLYITPPEANFIDANVIYDTSQINMIQDCLLLVLCSLYTEDYNLMPQERQMKDSFHAVRERNLNSTARSNWISYLIAASELGETTLSEDSCMTKYDSCYAPLWIIRPSFATLLYGWGTYPPENYLSSEIIG